SAKAKGKPEVQRSSPEAPPVADRPAEPRRAMALFCYEPADGPVGAQVSRTAAALARRGNAVHLFTRHAYPVAADAAGLLAQVNEFTSRATNAFLRQFPSGSDVTLMGYEWSSGPALSLLRGIS